MQFGLPLGGVAVLFFDLFEVSHEFVEVPGGLRLLRSRGHQPLFGFDKLFFLLVETRPGGIALGLESHQTCGQLRGGGGQRFGLGLDFRALLHRVFGILLERKHAVGCGSAPAHQPALIAGAVGRQEAVLRVVGGQRFGGSGGFHQVGAGQARQDFFGFVAQRAVNLEEIAQGANQAFSLWRGQGMGRHLDRCAVERIHQEGRVAGGFLPQQRDSASRRVVGINHNVFEFVLEIGLNQVRIGRVKLGEIRQHAHGMETVPVSVTIAVSVPFQQEFADRLGEGCALFNQAVQGLFLRGGRCQAAAQAFQKLFLLLKFLLAKGEGLLGRG